MSEAHEVAEKIEHAAHEQHGGDGGKSGPGHAPAHGSLAKQIGVTMAIIGVLLAVCSALVGAERTELTKTMVEQSNTYAEYQAASTKYRAMMAQVQQTYAVTPSRQATADALARLDAMPVPKEEEQLAAVQKAGLKELVGILVPRKKSEVESFLATIDRYDDERQAARAWADSFDDEVTAHFEGSEQYENALLIAEIAIVIASVALLMGSKRFWYAALVAAVVCGGLVAKTWFDVRRDVRAGEELQRVAREHYGDLRGKADEAGVRLADRRDRETLAKIRERFGLAPAPAATP